MASIIKVDQIQSDQGFVNVSSNLQFSSGFTMLSPTLSSPTLTTPTTSGVMTLGAGIKFPASQNASSDPNTLDDYEEGTWSPRLYQNGVEVTSATNIVGRYVKIGRTIYISGYWYKSSSPNNSSGQWSFRNLPYAAQGGVGDFVSAGYMGLNSSQSTQPARFQANGSDLLELYGQYSGTTWNTGYLEFSFSGVLLALS